MSDNGFIEQIKVWFSVYKRISFFKGMYPLRAIFADIFLFPIDYMFHQRDIKTLRNITIAVTHRCNIRCQMCYFREKLGNTSDLSFETYKKIINSVKTKRPCIILSGGEPFLHPNIIDMVGYAKKHRLPVQIFTNGTLLNENIIKELVSAGLDYIDFSLLGNENSHSLLANTPNAYANLIANLKYFAAHRNNTKVILNYTITPQAINDIAHAVELVKRYKLDGLRIQHYNFLLPEEFAEHKTQMGKIFSIDPAIHEIDGASGVKEVADRIIDFKKSLNQELPSELIQWAPSLTNKEINNWYSTDKFQSKRKCLFPWRGMLIDADGKMYLCSKIYLELGNIETENIFDIWNCAKMKKIRGFLKRKQLPACHRCCKL